AGLGAVVGDRPGQAGTDGDHALLVDALPGQVVGHRLGTALGQALVVGGSTDVVGVAGDLDDGLVVFGQGPGQVVEHRVELRLHVVAVKAEGDRARHVQGDVVAVAVHVHAGAGHLPAQFGFLAVLV